MYSVADLIKLIFEHLQPRQHLWKSYDEHKTMKTLLIFFVSYKFHHDSLKYCLDANM